jgi:hypothetical protein
MRSKINSLRHRLSGPGASVFVFGVVIAAVASVLAFQYVFATKTTATENVDSSRAVSHRKLVTLSSVGQPVVLDRYTGSVRPLEQDEKARLAQGLRQIINNSTDGLVEVRHEDGSVSMDLNGHFQNVMLARREADGLISESCVNDLEAAADFFQIDPQLLGLRESALLSVSRAGSKVVDR